MKVHGDDRSTVFMIRAETDEEQDWIEENVILTPGQRSALRGHTFFFCAVHSYLDSSLARGLSFWFKALTRQGPRREILILFPKLLLGRRWVQRIMSCLAQLTKPAAVIT